jgi:hypothetical protein
MTKSSSLATVHKLRGLVANEHSKLELALLKKKTFVMLSSESVQRPFLREVVEKEASEADQEVFSRFFPSQLSDSFAQPCARVGADPALADRRFKLDLVQSQSVLDSFTDFLEGEFVLDLEVLSLSLDRYIYF